MNPNQRSRTCEGWPSPGPLNDGRCPARPRSAAQFVACAGLWPIVFLICALASLSVSAWAADTNAASTAGSTATPPSALIKLSIEELMNLEVTSVKKSPEKLSQAAAAISVITGED